MTDLILVVEDERDVRKLLVDAFQFFGFEAVGVSDGDVAVREATTLQPDLVLMDVRMPNMSGLEACRILKAQDDTCHIPVVFLSAYGQEAEVRAGLEAGGTDYLLKPFAPNELIARIREILTESNS